MKANSRKTIVVLSFILLYPLFGNAQESQIFLIVNFEKAKLTEGENSNSKILKILSIGDRLKLLGIAFPKETNSAERYKVEFQETEGYISSNYLEPIMIINDQLISLADLYQDERKKYLERQKFLNDSLEENRIKKIKESSARQKLIEDQEIRKNDSIADLMLKKARVQIQITNKKNLDERRKKFISKYGANNGEKIATRKIWIGMTEEMLRDSWGIPEDINSTVTRYSTRKQYVYGNGQYVYVINGLVESYQN